MSKKGKTVRRAFKLSVVVDGAKTEFSEGMGVGVLITQTVVFNLPAEKYACPTFAAGLAHRQDLLRDEVIRTTVEEVPVDSDVN